MNNTTLENALTTVKSYSWYSSKLWKGLHNGKYITPEKADKIMGDMYNDIIVYIIQMEEKIELQKNYISSLQNALNVTINKNKGIIDR